MLGIPANCSTSGSALCYVSCEHSNNVRALYSQHTGSIGAVKIIIDAFLEQQETFLKSMCEASPSVKGLAEVAGIKTCLPSLIDNCCETICGESKRTYSVGCDTCTEQTFTDEFYLSAISLSKNKLSPTGANIRYLIGIFGWSVIYDTDYINIDVGADDPSKAFSILHLLPKPLGVEFRIVGDC